MTSQCANGDVATCRTPTFPVDTHIHRLAQRWGLTKGKTVEQTEADLKVVFRPVVNSPNIVISIGLLKDFPIVAMPDSTS